MSRSAPLALLAVSLLLAVAGCSRDGDFRHAAHLTVTKGDCIPCHGPDPAAPRRAADADCAACHRKAREAGPSGAGRYGIADPPPAAAPPTLYAGATFSHAPHAAAGIPCAACHADSKWRGNAFMRPVPEECTACHAGSR